MNDEPAWTLKKDRIASLQSSREWRIIMPCVCRTHHASFEDIYYSIMNCLRLTHNWLFFALVPWQLCGGNWWQNEQVSQHLSAKSLWDQSIFEILCQIMSIIIPPTIIHLLVCRPQHSFFLEYWNFHSCSWSKTSWQKEKNSNIGRRRRRRWWWSWWFHNCHQSWILIDSGTDNTYY